MDTRRLKRAKRAKKDERASEVGECLSHICICDGCMGGHTVRKREEEAGPWVARIHNGQGQTIDRGNGLGQCENEERVERAVQDVDGNGGREGEGVRATDTWMPRGGGLGGES